MQMQNDQVISFKLFWSEYMYANSIKVPSMWRRLNASVISHGDPLSDKYLHLLP